MTYKFVSRTAFKIAKRKKASMATTNAIHVSDKCESISFEEYPKAYNSADVKYKRWISNFKDAIPTYPGYKKKQK